MTSPLLNSLWGQYHWALSLLTGFGIIALNLVFGRIVRLITPVREAINLNAETLSGKMERPNYAATQKWSMQWSTVSMAVIFLVILPFCLTIQNQSITRILRDLIVILMVYDFFYYLTHRFLFHDSNFFGGPLKWMHAIHHRQHNPCRGDASYLHPLESAIGTGLFVACIFALSHFMGNFHVVTIIISFFAFSQINLHNHNLWQEDELMFGYIGYAARMHHNHHARFTGGNFATITLLYDWLFGTLDHGQGWQKKANR
ncbi:MAG: hypothetical protein RLZZ136_834 [Pseudomonadota bacterium]|jgi:sterol desaturase/sphingolipid hydroxylase (fatty acid hydroxylase superfamily)